MAIKQARSKDYTSQWELLKEAEKLSKLRDHPNVVNIKGITIEMASMKKYSLILTLYTLGNLEGHLKKQRGKMTLEDDLPKMLSWALEVR